MTALDRVTPFVTLAPSPTFTRNAWKDIVRPVFKFTNVDLVPPYLSRLEPNLSEVHVHGALTATGEVLELQLRLAVLRDEEPDNLFPSH